MSEKEYLEQLVKDVLQEGIDDGTRLKLYNDWATNYDKDMLSSNYIGPRLIAETLAECYPEDRENKLIIDVAAGTGLVGQELHKVGFRLMDALDPSQKSLEIAKSKSIYRTLFCDYITQEPLDIPESSARFGITSDNEANYLEFITDIYDALTICGGMGNGHLPCGALHEIIRLVKPGGFVVIVTNPAHLENVKAYIGQFETLMDKLEMARKWKKIKKETFSNYVLHMNGLCMVYQVV